MDSRDFDNLQMLANLKSLREIFIMVCRLGAVAVVTADHWTPTS